MNKKDHLEEFKVRNNQEAALLQGLSRSLCEGDPQAWAALYKRFYDPINHFVAHIIRSREDASDITQEVFISLWNNLHNVDPEKNIKGYVYAIASSLSFRFLRERAKLSGRTSTESTAAVSLQDFAPDDILTGKETDVLIALTLEEMPPQRRQVFEMSRFERLSADQIAEKLTLSKRTVENQLYRATKQLKETLYVIYLIGLFLPQITFLMR